MMGLKNSCTFEEYTYKLLEGAIFKNRGLRIESEHNMVISGDYKESAASHP